MKSQWIATVVLALLASAGSTLAQSTAFTYHGRLNNNAAPVTGLYDLRFTIFDSSGGATVVAGPLPANSLGITNGLFTARLDFGAGVFTGPPRWLEISVRPSAGGNFQTLSPRQELTSSPYAIRAQTAGTAADVSNGSVVKSLNNLRDHVTLAAGANVTIAPSGNTLTISSTGVGGNTNIWNVSGTNTYYNAGNVGIGNPTPVGKLDIAGAQDALRIIGPQAFLTFHDSSAGYARGRIQSVSGELALFAENYMNGSDLSAFLKLAANGSVGIGSPNPVGKLEIVAQDALRLVGFQPFLTFYDSNAGFARGRIQGVNGDLGLTTDAYIVSGGANPAAGLLVLKNLTGHLGIGTANPGQDLHILGVDSRARLQATDGFSYAATEYLTDARIWHTGVGGSATPAVGNKYYIFDGTAGQFRLVVEPNGNVGIGTTIPQAKLDVAGTIRTSVLTITGGADIAEPFQMSSDEIPKGSVVVIDEQNPGRLKLSASAYDTRVAGIVSGANGVKPGISLHQEGVLEGGENVALSGRVYVQADATSSAIKFGDLLTISDTFGHAMKVAEHARAQGAILGKAMTGLKEGKGLVLVLVTLQ